MQVIIDIVTSLRSQYLKMQVSDSALASKSLQLAELAKN